ncbi:MAG: phosphoribosyltransferase [Acaryochloris sp. RU_4_1]|nr:phosphoribosyltransferase [Acaryochloris sp. RU_4_1]NJR56237.1 phosphoribosyltransferase [Acaryochloris sp. CRU_2_0]
MPADLYISWSEYYQQIEKLAVIIDQSGWRFNQILCLARGGLRAGDVLSRIYRQPLAILATSSYGGTQGQERHSLTIGRELTMATPQLGKRVLLVDDLVDSGITLEQTLVWLKHKYGAEIKEVRTAVLWYKACSIVQPTYYVDYLAENPWIHQPFEGYERTNLEELGRKHPSISLRTISLSTSSTNLLKFHD